MPEAPVLKAWQHEIQRSLAKTRSSGSKTYGRFVWYPRSFAIDPDYQTCIAKQLADYDLGEDIDLTSVTGPHVLPNQWDVERSQGTNFEYLLGLHTPGMVFCGVKGKIMAIAAGKHLVFVNFGLEGCPIRVSAEDYKELAAPSQDMIGPNPDSTVAKYMRSFRLPDRFKDPHSLKKNEDLRFLNIFMSIELDNGEAWLFVDHVRFIRFEVWSRASDWSEADISCGSSIWSTAFGGMYGPDMFQEPKVAVDCMKEWRAASLLKLQTSKSSTLTTPLADAMCADMKTFNGFGRHTATDALHAIGLLPYMPVAALIHSDALFALFTNGLVEYVEQFNEPKFFTLVASHSTHANPLAYRYDINRQYINMYVGVYRKAWTYLDITTYNAMAREGLFDPMHVIGRPYTQPFLPVTGQAKKKVMVFAHYRPNHVSEKKKKTSKAGNTRGQSLSKKTFSVILAWPPPSWKIPRWIIKPVKKDLRADGQKTTIGVGQFRAFNLNMTHLGKHLVGQPGRIAIERTGKPGRPTKPKTIAAKRKLAQAGKDVVYDPELLSRIQESFKVYESTVSAHRPDTYDIRTFFVEKSMIRRRQG